MGATKIMSPKMAISEILVLVGHFFFYEERKCVTVGVRVGLLSGIQFVK